jgi:dTDP-glucose 4,6-dehydratase
MSFDKVLILGLESFAGSHFTNYLLNNDVEVVGTYRKGDIDVPFCTRHENLKRYVKDIQIHTDEIIALIKNQTFDCIFNFAGKTIVPKSWTNPHIYLRVNALAPMKIIYEAEKHINKFIQMSTPEVYGNINGKENDIYNPSTPYAVSKACLDMYTKCMHKHKDFPIINTRASNWFGPYQQVYKLIPTTILSILREKELKLHGGGTTSRNFIYIEDVCNAFDTIMRKGKTGETYHISGDDYCTVKSLVETICKKMDYPSEKLIGETKDRLGKDKDYKLINSKLKKIGWLPTNISYGLGKTIKWYTEEYKWK